MSMSQRTGPSRREILTGKEKNVKFVATFDVATFF